MQHIMTFSFVSYIHILYQSPGVSVLPLPFLLHYHLQADILGTDESLAPYHAPILQPHHTTPPGVDCVYLIDQLAAWEGFYSSTRPI